MIDMYKQLPQDLGLCGFLFEHYSEECLIQNS